MSFLPPQVNAASAERAPGATTTREVLLLDNPLAGTHDHDRHVQELIRALHVLGLETTVCNDLGDLSRLARTEAARFRCIVAAGGDGTLNAVLNRAPGLPVAVLPVGNENLVARFFGVGRSAEQLADAIAASSVERLDLGRIDGRLFTVMASVGIDAQVVHEVHQNRRGHIGKWNYVGPTVRALGAIPSPRSRSPSRKPATPARVDGVLLQPADVRPGPATRAPARADDGCLDMVVFERPGRVNLARYVTALVARRHEKLADVQVRRVKRASLRSAVPVPIQIDGDPAGNLPATIEIVPETFHLILPGRSPLH